MENTKKIIEAFFNSKDKIVYGFVVLQKFYSDLCTITDENKEISCNLYPLLSSLNDSMQDVFNHIDLNYLCDNFRWLSFTQNVLKASVLMPKNEKQMEIQALIQLNMLIGKRLANSNPDVKKRWYEYLRVFDCDDIEQEYQEIVSRCVFSFLESQILFDKHNLILTFFYNKLLKSGATISACFIRVFLLTSCYLYYLGFREEERYVNDQDRGLRSRSGMIFDQTIDKLKKILETIAYRDVNLNSEIINNLFSYMKTSLSSYELFIPEEFKPCIMNNVVDEFVLHSLVYIRSETILNISINKIMDDEQAESLFLMLKTNDTIHQWYKFFLEKFNDKKRDETTYNSFIERYETSYNLFVKELEIVYKQNLIKKGEMPKEENYQIIEKKISQRLSEFLEPYKNDICTNYITTTLLSSMSIPNSIELEMLLSSFIDYILGNIVVTLFNRMKKNNEAALFKRSKMINDPPPEYSKIDDENLLKLIEKHKGHIYMGGEGLLLPINIYSYYDRYNNAVKGLSKKHSIAGFLGVFIDPAKIKIFIKNISISRVAKTIQECNAIEDNGLYKYAPTGIEMTYTKEELEEYLKLNESVLTISADVGYDIEPGTKVDFIYMK